MTADPEDNPPPLDPRGALTAMTEPGFLTASERRVQGLLETHQAKHQRPTRVEDSCNVYLALGSRELGGIWKPLAVRVLAPRSHLTRGRAVTLATTPLARAPCLRSRAADRSTHRRLAGCRVQKHRSLQVITPHPQIHEFCPQLPKLLLPVRRERPRLWPGDSAPAGIPGRRGHRPATLLAGSLRFSGRGPTAHASLMKTPRSGPKWRRASA